MLLFWLLFLWGTWEAILGHPVVFIKTALDLLLLVAGTNCVRVLIVKLTNGTTMSRRHIFSVSLTIWIQLPSTRKISNE